jgi:hypothetical protein
LLDGFQDGNGTDVIADCMSLVPHARSVRSHSLTQNERIIDQFKRVGLSHISNTFIPNGSGIQLKPFYLWDQMIVVPHSWQDNVALKMNLDFPLSKGCTFSFKVLDFHPIHVYLNTESLNRYESTRSLHQNPKELIKYRYNGYGTRNRLIEVLGL